MAVNVDHVHLFVKYPPKYSVSYIAKRIKGRGGVENCAKYFHTSRDGAIKLSGHHLASMVRLVMGGGLWRDTYKIRRSRMQKRYAQVPYLSPGFSEFF